MNANQHQHEAWNGGESIHYVDHADRYDRQLGPFTDALFGHVRLEAHHAVLDIGCGCGATTIRAAGAARTALGADLSVPLIEVAAGRAGAASLDNAGFVVADAQTHAFGDGAFDALISQFGVMFFDDPVTAFANLRRALVPGGRAAFVVWRGIEDNEWLMVLARVVAQHVALPELGGQAGGPGMFALRDPGETAELLGAAGFTGVSFEPLSPGILLGGGGTVDEALDFLAGMGMARGLLGLVGPDRRDAVIGTVRESLAGRLEPGVGVRLGAGAWLVSAGNDRADA